MVHNMSSHNNKVGEPTILIPPSKEITSASVDEGEVAPCFLHAQEIGIRVRGPTRFKKNPPVELESERSPAKPASQNKAR